MQISQINLLHVTIQAYLEGTAYLSEIADALEEPLNKIYALFWHNNIINANSEIQPWVNYQDIVNTILLYYALRPYHDFVSTTFPPPKQIKPLPRGTPY